jgi:hypothetical protein
MSPGGEYLFHLLLSSLEGPNMFVVWPLGFCVVLEAVWVLGLVSVYSDVRSNSDVSGTVGICVEARLGGRSVLDRGV